MVKVNETSAKSSMAITSNNHGGYILITTLLCMVWSILFYCMRVAIRMGSDTYFGWDDLAATVATAFGTAQSICVALAVYAGLGRRLTDLTSKTLERTELLIYSGNILFIIAVAFAKIATFELIARLTQQTRHSMACRVLSTVTLLWALVGILVIAIGCHTSHPWNMAGRCFNSTIAWFALGIVDIALEICLLILPLWMIWPLQMPLNSKLIVLFAFGCRFPLIAVIALRVAFLERIQSSSDYTFDLSIAMVWLEVEMHYSLISMTVACLRPFLRFFNTGSLGIYAAQFEKGMAASSNAETIALRTQDTDQSSYRRNPRHISSSLRSPSISTTSTGGKQLSEDRTTHLPAHLESLDEQLKLDPVASPAITHIVHEDDDSISDGESSRYMIRKTVGYGVRYSPELIR